MDIYEKIDIMFSGEAEDKPKWAEDILRELQDIKTLLYKQKQQNTKVVANNSNDYYDFIKEFRKSMRANTANNIYPTFYYQHKKLGIDFKGLIYDKESLDILPRDEAFKIYKYLYNNQNNMGYSA